MPRRARVPPIHRDDVGDGRSQLCGGWSHADVFHRHSYFLSLPVSSTAMNAF